MGGKYLNCKLTALFAVFKYSIKIVQFGKMSLEVKFAQNSPALRNGLLGVPTSFTVGFFARNNLLRLTTTHYNFLLFVFKKSVT